GNVKPIQSPPTVLVTDTGAQTVEVPLDDACFLYDHQKTCLNDGKCFVNGNNKPECRCTTAYTGNNCQTAAATDDDLLKILVPVAAIAGLLFVIAICCCCWFLCARRKKWEPEKDEESNSD
ncbi:Hypothetical predicted protein, partial [Mytilus galloprovincialis]